MQKEAEQPKHNHERLITEYLPEDPETRTSILEWLDNFPELPTDPQEAFTAIHQELVRQGFEYDNQTFMLEDVIQTRKGNCLGLSVLFGMIFESKGISPNFEVAVNPKDAHYTNDLKQFDRLIHGEVFAYDSPPDLPTGKAEFPQNWFAPLEHPIISVNGQRYETTTLIDDPEQDLKHDFQHESIKPITLENLFGSLYTSKAKTLLLNPENNPQTLIALVRKGLELWPDDRQGWLFMRDLGIQTFDDALVAEAEANFTRIGGNDSLYYFSMYEITGETQYLDKALEIYPAYVEAYVQQKVRPPFANAGVEQEARFDLTTASMCIANSTEISLEWFYLRNLERFKEAFGASEMAEFLYDLELDEKMPAKYYEALYVLDSNPENLVKAFENGSLLEASPFAKLHFCLSVTHAKASAPSEQFIELKLVCAEILQQLQTQYGNSKHFQTILEAAH